MRTVALLFAIALGIEAQTVSVTGQVAIVRKQGAAGGADSANAVVWLTPFGSASAPLVKPGTFEILQKKKHFLPHVLVAPIGSTVSFPNLDPFFHNVFSMFEGKRFDLGLYESGATARVKFDRAGISYIFCNIHPEMSAVVVAVNTPYYAVTNKAGQFAIADVPAGRYMLAVWHERATAKAAPATIREVTISPEATALPKIELIDAGHLILPHKNKYGQDYEVPSRSEPVYK
ncbi:MAG: hypothetical protein IT168_01340 [Bryobacterales bacterium]|nr:hypothetical protein [Bryobacterales bacterium]